MKTPLNNLIAGGKRLLAKVRLHYQQDPTTLPPDQQVTVAELEAWYRGVEAAMEKAFGTDSHELRTWHFRREQIKEQELENITRRTGPIVVSRLENTLGVLEELKVATTAFAESSGEAIEQNQATSASDAIHQLLQKEEGSQLEFKAALRCLRNEKGDRPVIGLALPDTKWFHKYVSKVSRSAKSLRISLYWVRPDKSVAEETHE